MKNRRIHKIYSGFLVTLLAANLAIFTLHSHYSAQLHQSDQHQASESITSDITVCPICASIFKTSFTPSFSCEPGFDVTELLDLIAVDEVIDSFVTSVKGRSPPSIG